MASFFFSAYLQTDSKAAGELAKETDVNVLTGLLKLYFRELPEALFTDSLYPSLVNGMSEFFQACGF